MDELTRKILMDEKDIYRRRRGGGLDAFLILGIANILFVAWVFLWAYLFTKWF